MQNVRKVASKKVKGNDSHSFSSYGRRTAAVPIELERYTIQVMLLNDSEHRGTVAFAIY
jgi:hypothetical protein